MSVAAVNSLCARRHQLATLKFILCGASYFVARKNNFFYQQKMLHLSDLLFKVSLIRFGSVLKWELRFSKQLVQFSKQLVCCWEQIGISHSFKQITHILAHAWKRVSTVSYIFLFAVHVMRGVYHPFEKRLRVYWSIFWSAGSIKLGKKVKSPGKFKSWKKFAAEHEKREDSTHIIKKVGPGGLVWSHINYLIFPIALAPARC